MNVASVARTLDAWTPPVRQLKPESALQLSQMLPQVKNSSLPEELRTLDKLRLAEARSIDCCHPILAAAGSNRYVNAASRTAPAPEINHNNYINS